MLTDTALRNLKPKPYKASDRDGMYVTVSPGISLAMARAKLLDAKRMVAPGKTPSLEKQRAKRRLTAVNNFGETLTS